MAKFYWLRLHRDFFKRHDIKIIESMENGKDYVLFLLKLMAESVDHEGRLRFNAAIPYNESMLATITGTNIDIVRSAIRLFVELGLLERWDDETLYMSIVATMIGSRSESADRVARHRARKSELGVLQVTKSNVTSNSISRSRSLKNKTPKIIQHQTLDVPIGETRYGNLCTDYGREYIDRRIEAAILWAEEKGVVVKDYAARVGTWILKDNIEKKRPHKVCPECSKEYIGTLCVYCGYEEGKA